MNKALLALPLAITAANGLFAGATFASEVDSDSKEKPLMEIVITGSRAPTPVSKVLSPITVITKDDINRLQPPSLAALLGSTAGVSMQQSGSAGSQTNLMIRGTDNDQSVILLDGLRISSATSGGTPIQFIDPFMLDRVELVRGPRSSLYGADAIGGVVQLITNDGHAKYDYNKALIKQSIGSHHSLSTTLGLKGQNDKFFYSLNGTHSETQGFDSTPAKTHYNDDNEAFRNSTYALGAGYHVSDDVTLSAHYFESDGKAEYDNTFSQAATSPYSDYRIKAYSIKADARINSYWRSELTLGQSLTDSIAKDNLDASSSDKFNTQRESYNWLNEINIANNQRLIAGIDYQDDSIDVSKKGYDEDERNNLAFYVQHEIELGKFKLSTSGRSDNNEAYGRNNTGQVELGYQINDQVMIGSSYGTAFRAPTFNDLYYPGYDNPDLQPEKSKNSEIFAKGYYGNSTWQANIFHNDMTDMIIGDDHYIPQNIDEATLEGAELAFGTTVADYSLNTNYTYLKTKDGNGDELVYRPRHTLNIDISKQIGNLTTTLTQQIKSKAYGKSGRLNGYGLTNLRWNYDITHDISVSLALNNLFNKQYVLNDGYNTDGFNTLLSVAYTPSW